MLVDENGNPHAYRNTREVAQDKRDLEWMGPFKCLRVVELRPGERVIESPGGRGGKRGRG